MGAEIFGMSQLDEAHQKELIRKHLENLTTSYSDESDIFTEIIQNAVDAVTSRSTSVTGPGELTIVVGRRKGNAHYLYVQDNGVGMSPQLVDKVFIPGFSSGKRQGRSIGYKGVGMSYVVAVSDHMAIRSVTAEGAVERTILHTSDWVTDSEKPEPTVSGEFQAPERVKDLALAINGGTGVYFSFHAGSDPGSLDKLVIVSEGIDKELRHWAGFLCAKTALGVTSAPSSTPIVVRIILDRGDDEVEEAFFTREYFEINEGKLGYPFPEKVFRVGEDTDVIDGTPLAQQHQKHARKHQAVFHEWPGEQLIGEIDNLDEEERSLLLTHLSWVRGYLAYSTDVLKQVQRGLGARRPVVRYGARLSVDGAPQGRPLELALTSDQGLDRQTHIVLGFNEIELDTGRKFISDERILAAINKVTQRVVTKLKDYRWALKIKDKQPIESDLTAWRNRVASRAGNSNIPELFTILGAVSPSKVDPDSEQEVISLWTALLTTGALPGFAMKAISGFNRYDALVDIGDEAMTAGGNLPAVSPEFTASMDRVLEFKWSFDDLISDFESKAKIPSEIDLVVCWDCPDMNLRLGSLEPTYGKWSHARPFRATSYVWSDDTNSVHIPVITLRNVVAELLSDLGRGTGKASVQVLQNRDAAKLV